METVSSAPPEDTSEANPSSVKSEDSSPRHDNRSGSPPPNCAICLGACKNKSFTDSCLHQFCFNCLLRWSKVKAECPLCKQNFKSIIHNVRSNHQYEEYMVEQRTTEAMDRIDIEDLTTANRRFRYRTTLTLPRRDTLAIRDLLMHYQPLSNVYSHPATRTPPVFRRRRSPSLFRRTVYRHNLWARPLPDFTGRFRDCTPEFYRYNNTQMYRLVPWLNRELHYLLNENMGHISYVIERMLELLPQYHISSAEFREAMVRYLGDRTDHFLHELYCFASTPYDLSGYDRNVQYTTDTRVSTMIVNEVISSSDSEASVDSDIVVISSSEPANPPPGPSRLPAPTYPQNFIPPPANNPITIESISHSDTDDDSSEVMVVGYIKPPQERTPEVVDLLGSDSDVVVQDTEPASLPALSAEEPRVPMVKLSLRRTEESNNKADSDSEDSAYTPPPPKRRRTSRSNDYATTSDTSRSTPSRHSMAWESDSSFLSYHSTCTSPSSSTTTVTCSYSDSDSSELKKSKKRNRRKRKEGEPSTSNEKKKRKKRSHKSKSVSQSTEKDKKSKRKSKSGKGVKSSKNNQLSQEVGDDKNAVPLDQPSTSGTSSSVRKSARDRKSRRSSRENKRLKSVVNVMNSNKNSCDSSSSGNSNLLDILSSSILNQNSNSGSTNGDLPLDLSKKVDSCFKEEVPENKQTSDNSSDSENNQNWF